LLARPDDRVALRCWCGFGNTSLNRSKWSRLRRHCADTGVPPIAALEGIADGDFTLPQSESLIARFRLLQARIGELEGLQGAELLDSLFPASEDWATPIRGIAEAFEEDGEPNELLEIIRRGITQPELPTDVSYVRVMSLHKSKGLTADFVVVAGCIQGLVPTLSEDLPQLDAQNELEEQRRLFYVAITRTTQTLVLSSVSRIPRADAHKMGARVRGGDRSHAYTIASQFLGELGPDRPGTVRGSTVI
jgi:DNA helicase II / ATP-dependent DNA helicase PcrA